MEMRKMGEPAAVPEQLRATAKPELESAASVPALRGRVLMANTHDGLPGATVLVKGTTIGTSTDAGGNFELPVPAALATKEITLVFSSIGFFAEERTVRVADGSLLITMPLNTQVLGGLIVVPAVLPPAPWHPRRFYYWGRYWLLRPFGRS